MAARQICQDGEGERQGGGLDPEFETFLQPEKEFANRVAPGGFMKYKEDSMIP